MERDEKSASLKQSWHSVLDMSRGLALSQLIPKCFEPKLLAWTTVLGVHRVWPRAEVACLTSQNCEVELDARWLTPDHGSVCYATLKAGLLNDHVTKAQSPQ